MSLKSFLYSLILFSSPSENAFYFSVEKYKFLKFYSLYKIKNISFMTGCSILALTASGMDHSFSSGLLIRFICNFTKRSPIFLSEKYKSTPTYHRDIMTNDLSLACKANSVYIFLLLNTKIIFCSFFYT